MHKWSQEELLPCQPQRAQSLVFFHSCITSAPKPFSLEYSCSLLALPRVSLQNSEMRMQLSMFYLFIFPSKNWLLANSSPSPSLTLNGLELSIFIKAMETISQCQMASQQGGGELRLVVVNSHTFMYTVHERKKHALIWFYCLFTLLVWYIICF